MKFSKQMFIFVIVLSLNIVLSNNINAQEEHNPIDIPAKPINCPNDILTSTDTKIMVGDTVYIRATGEWSVGYGYVGPDGKGSSCYETGGCPVDAPFGALIGRIGRNGKRFLIGSQKSFIADSSLVSDESDTLFLGSNDNEKGTCDGHNKGSCYCDNEGSLKVWIYKNTENFMNSTWDEENGTLSIFRNGNLVVVYQRDTSLSRSIANSITELYAVGKQGHNLLSDLSPLVPPQICIEVDSFDCLNAPNETSCDYFTHHNPVVSIVQPFGSEVEFNVKVDSSTQHNDNGKPIAYSSNMTVKVPYHEEHVIIEYKVETSLKQKQNVRHALRPFPFYELVNNPYDSISYLDSNYQVFAVPIPTTKDMVFINDSSISNICPWAAIYNNTNGNLGIILKSWEWLSWKSDSVNSDSAKPVLLSYTEYPRHPKEPNLYFKSSIHTCELDSGKWNGEIIFLAYTNGNDYKPVQQFRDSIDSCAGVVMIKSDRSLPSVFTLYQNCPNPFNLSTEISYSIPISDFVTLKVYDILGREIEILVNEFQETGEYSINFDASNLSCGIYFYRLQVGKNSVDTKKMLLLR